MAAEADDLRYWYGETIGRTVVVSAGAGSATALAEELELGRYMLRCLDFGGGTDLWVAQGKFGSVEAAAAAPSARFVASTVAADLNRPLAYLMARPGLTGLSFFMVGGTGASVHITKVSRGKA